MKKQNHNALGAALLTLVRQTQQARPSSIFQTVRTVSVQAAMIDPDRATRPARFSADLERAHQGIMPRVPRFAPTIEERLAPLKRKVTRAAREHCLTELRELQFSASSGSRKKLERYRQLAIIATEARIAALAERRRAGKR